VPDSSWNLLKTVLHTYPGTLLISRPRKTKLGDFKVNLQTGQVRISVNSDLNEYSFLITLLHEIAHFFTWKNHKKSVLPHGAEWKSEFKSLITPFIETGVFPERIESALQRHFKSPKASSCTDEVLFKELDAYNVPDDLQFISDLPLGSYFSFQKRGKFQITERLRKRILCTHFQSGKKYLFQPVTKVRLVVQ